MTAITLDEAKRDLEKLIARVVSDAEPAVVTTSSGHQIVLMALEEFNAWQETAYLLSSPANAAHLQQSIAEQQSGKSARHELIEP